ncbi:MAG: hypothetical protein WBC80_09540, partial [Isosphaeraceae bacterium]
FQSAEEFRRVAFEIGQRMNVAAQVHSVSRNRIVRTSNTMLHCSQVFGNATGALQAASGGLLQ